LTLPSDPLSDRHCPHLQLQLRTRSVRRRLLVPWQVRGQGLQGRVLRQARRRQGVQVCPIPLAIPLRLSADLLATCSTPTRSDYKPYEYKPYEHKPDYDHKCVLSSALACSTSSESDQTIYFAEGTTSTTTPSEEATTTTASTTRTAPSTTESTRITRGASFPFPPPRSTLPSLTLATFSL
jgi:hypothetical protein